MTAGDPTVFIIDDYDLVRAAIQGLLKSVGLHTGTFGSTFGGRERCIGSQKDQEGTVRNSPCYLAQISAESCWRRARFPQGRLGGPNPRGCQLFPGNRGFGMFKQGIARPG
jgi:hypothetical protein